MRKYKALYNHPVKAEKKVTQGTKPGAKSRRRKKQNFVLYKHPQSKIEATKGVSLKGDTGSHIDHSLKETQSSLAKDLNPSQLPSSTLVAVGMHKEAQQATSGPTSLGVTSEEGAHPQLRIGTKPTVHNVEFDLCDLELPLRYQPHIVQEHDYEKSAAEKMTLNSKLVKEREYSEAEAAWFKAQPSFPNVDNLTVEILRDLKEIPSKLEKFTSTVSSLTTQVVELKTLQWELPVKFLSIPGQVSSIQAKVESLSKRNNFLTLLLKRVNICIYTHQIKEQKRLYETTKVEMDKKQEEVVKEELIDLLSKITNCDVLTRKGPITLKVYREDGNDEVIPDFKASDLHLSEWREVMQVCPSRKEAGWSTIYEKIKKIMDYLHKTEAKLGIDFSKPLIEQEPLDKLNDLAKKEEKT
ncbi:hypothetical protein Tco_0370830 [Tanacetum coccineum]